MKKSYLLYIQILFIIGLVFSSADLRAQVTLNCESGNRGIEQGNCWGFGAVSYSRRDTHIISGFWSTLSNQLTSASPESCWIKTPWMLVGSGNITFKAKFDGTNGNSRGIQLYYIPYNTSNAPYFEGTPVLFYDYLWTQPYPTGTAKVFSVLIPAEIANSKVVYKIRMSMIGSGGISRLISDDLVFPGTYWSDPANGCLPKITIKDADSDGVPDGQDEYPADKNRAFNSYYPSANSFGTLAFEDLWPSRGDYDFNDVVVDYQFKTVTNSSNNVVEILGKVVARASGASFKNGFGFQLDGIPSNKVISTTGNHISSPSIINFASNGLEASQPYATCIAFDNFFTLMNHPGTGSGINTDKTAPFVKYDTLSIKIAFLKDGIPPSGGTVAISQLPSTAFNFFIIANQNRGKEIHLPNSIPTSLSNTALMGTGNDDSNISTGKYFKTKNNLPWGINIIGGFSYPIEKAPIDAAYLHFNEWAESGGTLYPQWYTNEAGNRVSTNIY